MGNSVRFEVDVSCAEGKYGLTLALIEEDNDDEVPCFFLVFDGPSGSDPVEIARLFGASHQEAMTSVNLEGQITEEEFASRLGDSVELAGELMQRHGFTYLEPDTLEVGVLDELFEPDEEPDPADLN